MKRYAVTYTIDHDWNTVDTFIVETDKNPLDMNDEEITAMFDSYIHNKEEAKHMPMSERWFCINLDFKPDVVMETGKR